MKLHTILLVNIMMVMSASCNGQRTSQKDNSTLASSALAVGDTVSELDKTIFIIFQDKNNNYWFGSDGQGVYRYDGKTMLNFTTKDGLCNDRIRELKEDKWGNIFINTLKGISKFDGQKFTTLTVAKTNVSGNEWKSEPDDLWFIGPQEKNGPYRYDGKALYDLEFPKHHLEDEFYTRNPRRPYTPYQVYTIYKDGKGNIWFGTAGLGICRFDGKSLSWMYEKHLTEVEGGGSFGIRSIIEDKQGKFWFCNTLYRYNIYPNDSVGGLISYRKEAGISNLKDSNGDIFVYFMSIIEDKKDELWMATYDRGLWRYDGKSATQYLIKDSNTIVRMYSFYKDRQGDLWLGTHNAGAYKFKGTTFEKFRP